MFPSDPEVDNPAKALLWDRDTTQIACYMQQVIFRLYILSTILFNLILPKKKKRHAEDIIPAFIKGVVGKWFHNLRDAGHWTCVEVTYGTF